MVDSGTRLKTELFKADGQLFEIVGKCDEMLYLPEMKEYTAVRTVLGRPKLLRLIKGQENDFEITY